MIHSMKWFRPLLACALMTLVALLPVSGMALPCPMMMPAKPAAEIVFPCHEAEAPVPMEKQSKSCCGSFACQACASHVTVSAYPAAWRILQPESIRYVPMTAGFASYVVEGQDPPPK
ncbi:MAG: hypothetical protein J0L97_07630 [Alphaproteobacteria bacterium]|nr:hypothetical protein [Alphaproteobacteria bacterium]